jgi:hypothetical protein
MRFTVLAFAALLPGSASAQDYIQFQSPTGNIHCGIWGGDFPSARCDLVEFTASFPLRPVDCEFDWGRAFGVEPMGPGYPLCHADTVIDERAPVLDYGRSVSLAGFTCLSERSGVTCTNAQGHGFSVARARQKVF